MNKDPVEIARRMDALNVWDEVLHYNWAVKPLGCAFPYFCTLWRELDSPVRIRFLILDGWQTLHDFVQTRINGNFGFYSTPMEMPHYEVVFWNNGEIKFFRHDPGYLPRPFTPDEVAFVGRILWESYGVMMRIENEHSLALRYSDENAMFARVEASAGVWEDSPLKISDPRPHVEKISLARSDISVAKDLPIDSKDVVEVDFRFLHRVFGEGARKRLKYVIVVCDPGKKESRAIAKMEVSNDCGLKEMWESVASRLLKFFIVRGHFPGEIRVLSGRMFRMLAPLGSEFPVKLSMYSKLPNLENAYRALEEQSEK